MQIKINNEQHFQVIAHDFVIGSSSTGYTLMFSADGKTFSPLFAVDANTERMVTNVASGSYYYLAGNSGELTVNWVKDCGTGGGGGGTAGVESINGQSGALNLKSVNGNSLLGTGDIVIEGGSGDYTIVDSLPEEPIEGEMIYLTEEQTVTGDIPVIGDGLVFVIESLPSDYTHFAGVYRVEGGSRGSEDAYFYKDYDSNVKGFINWYGDFDLTADTWTVIGNKDMLEVVYKVEDGKVYIAMVTRKAVAEDTLLPGEGITPDSTFSEYEGILGIYKPGNYVYNGTDWVSKDIPSISVIGNEVLTEDKQADFDKVIEAYINKQPYIVLWEGKSCTIWGNNEEHTEFDASYTYGQGSEIKSQGFTIRRNEASTIHTDLTLNIQNGFATRSGKAVEVPATDELIFDSANWFGNWEGNAIYDSNNEVLLWLEIWGTPRIGDWDFFDENKWHSFYRESSDTTIYARVEHYTDEVSGEERKKTYVRIDGENWTINPECSTFYTDNGAQPALSIGDTFKIMALGGWDEQDGNVRSIDLDFITLGGHKLDAQKLAALLALLEN